MKMKIKSIRIAIIAILLLSQFSLSAIAQSSKERSVHIGLIYPLSNHWTHAKEYSNILSLHAIAGVSKNEQAVSLAGLANIIQEEAKGVQLAGFLNSYENGKGFQLAGFANIARGEVHGVQLAGFINKASKVHGVQFAGFMNIADSSDYPIGIVNLIADGTKAVGISVDDDQTILASFRSGGRIMYGIVGLGFNIQNDKQRYALEAGFGAHLLTKNQFTLNVEAANTALIDFKKGMYSKGTIRLIPAYKISKNIEIYGGPAVSHIFTNTPEGIDMIKNDIWKDSLKDGEMNAVNIGFLGGVQLYF